jgi:MarR-like DNA-binding transcriptional regulator SgrR of sgrS sRNA
MEEADGYIFRLITEEEVVTPFENYRSDLSFIRAHMGDDIRHSCDRLLASVLKEPSAEARLGLIKMTERMLSENRSLLFLLHHKQVTTLHPAVRGLRYNPLGGIDFKDIWFQKT